MHQLQKKWYNGKEKNESKMLDVTCAWVQEREKEGSFCRTDGSSPGEECRPWLLVGHTLRMGKIRRSCPVGLGSCERGGVLECNTTSHVSAWRCAPASQTLKLYRQEEPCQRKRC